MFKIRICSDLDHEEIVADVCWDNQTLATINQDKGLENLEIELFSPQDQESWVVPFEKMIEIFCEAKKQLQKMQKKSD